MITVLEAGFEIFIVFIIAIVLAVLFVVSLVITSIVKAVYQSKEGRTFTRKQFWLTMLISTLILGLISGFVCGGM
ncbi:hypothetical protein ASG01_05090 [Chryseobacterium sp. Leaf180]|jgi:ABC-type Fe3+ transport system permease subunit|uniref:hypothetical protein n=1 Tax=Chryseobacterium sp. Leaf180 TaxID=1736289 RepID=UPI0006F51DE1|nr:hypothetical protein [Chryseobacterium sp. Leaf180]KQR95226.1 hypothetical protein ASG01_05090 [Chryseobacterium sp. Leaf180]